MELNPQQRDFIKALQEGDLRRAGKLQKAGADILPVMHAVAALGPGNTLHAPLVKFLQKHLVLHVADDDFSAQFPGYGDYLLDARPYEIKKFLESVGAKIRTVPVKTSVEMALLHGRRVELMLKRTAHTETHAPKSKTLQQLRETMREITHVTPHLKTKRRAEIFRRARIKKDGRLETLKAEVLAMQSPKLVKKQSKNKKPAVP